MINNVRIFGPVEAPKYLKYEASINRQQIYLNEGILTILGYPSYVDISPMPNNRISIIATHKDKENQHCFFVKRYRNRDGVHSGAYIYYNNDEYPYLQDLDERHFTQIRVMDALLFPTLRPSITLIYDNFFHKQ